MSSRARWEKIAENRRMRLNGKEEAEPKGAVHYAPSHHLEAERAERLRLYLATSPKGERNVEALLDAHERTYASRWRWRQARDVGGAQGVAPRRAGLLRGLREEA